jgi:hypothetical protein
MATKGARKPSNPAIRKIVRTVERTPGWRIDRTRDGWKMFAANGKDIVTIHDGSSDHRHIQAILSDLKRAGLTTI